MHVHSTSFWPGLFLSARPKFLERGEVFKQKFPRGAPSNKRVSIFFTKLLHLPGPLTETMIKIERLRFRYSQWWPGAYECWHLRTNKCVRTNICKKSVFVVSVRKINICGRILTQFTGLLRTNAVAAKRNLLAERTCLGKSVSVSLRKNGPYCSN